MYGVNDHMSWLRPLLGEAKNQTSESRGTPGAEAARRVMTWLKTWSCKGTACESGVDTAQLANYKASRVWRPRCYGRGAEQLNLE